MSKYDLKDFTDYYEQGQEFERNGQNEAASRFYLLASQSLLKLAQKSDGKLKEARMDRAERLIKKADLLLLAPPSPEITMSVSGIAPEKDTAKFVAVEKPSDGFDDVAGLDEVKEVIFESFIYPRKYPDIYSGIKLVAGVLMYGLPGTGKTMIAKAIAHEVDATFYSVACSDIMNKWVGESEKNVRELFETARRADRAVIFFDEFESLGASRDTDSDAKRSLVNELLTQIQGFSEKNGNILLLAATNRPQDMDSAFLRPKRFTPFYIPLPDFAARKYIIEKAYKDYPIEKDICFDDLAEFMENFSGADVSDFCEYSKRLAAKRCRETTQRAEDLLVTKEDINACRAKIHSSIQMKDIVELENFRKQNHRSSIDC